MGTNPTAGTVKDAGRVASQIRQAGAVAEWRREDAPTTSRAASIYLAANKAAGGPRPTRQASPWGAWWTIPRHEVERCEIAAMFHLAPNPAGELGTATAAEIIAAWETEQAGEPEAEPP